MLREVDQETVAIGMIVCYLEFPRARESPVLGDWQSEGRGRGQTMDESLIVVSAGRKMGKEEQAS